MVDGGLQSEVIWIELSWRRIFLSEFLLYKFLHLPNFSSANGRDKNQQKEENSSTTYLKNAKVFYNKDVNYWGKYRYTGAYDIVQKNQRHGEKKSSESKTTLSMQKSIKFMDIVEWKNVCRWMSRGRIALDGRRNSRNKSVKAKSTVVSTWWRMRNTCSFSSYNLNARGMYLSIYTLTSYTIAHAPFYTVDKIVIWCCLLFHLVWLFVVVCIDCMNCFTLWIRSNWNRYHWLCMFVSLSIVL